MSTEQLIDLSNGNYAHGVILVKSDGSTYNATDATENHIGTISGTTTAVGVSFTRPSNTTAYAALAAVSNSTSAPTVLTFTNLARIATGSGYIVKGMLFTDQSTNVARFRLHLYHTAPTAINDGSQFTSLYVNASKKIGYIDFAACATEGTGSTAASSLVSTLSLSYTCDAASRTIYGILETLDPFTPASAQNFYIELTAENN